MQRLLIADSSEEFTAALAEVFHSDFDILSCQDGETALELLLSFRPDILILNLMLPFKDGLTLLQEAAYVPPLILAVTTYTNPYIERRALELGISMLLIMPTPSTVRVRVMDMVRSQATCDKPADFRSQTILHLHILNFDTNSAGYRQLCIGIPIFRKDPRQVLSCELYPAIGIIDDGRDQQAVEHTIRDAIQKAWKQRDPAVWIKYFPPDPKGRLRCPSNKKFICRLAEMLEE